MKIITLVPVKNEAWILRFSLKHFSLFSDEILILDDSSSDELADIASSFPKAWIISLRIIEVHVDMSYRRNILLEEGRKRGGTHFIMLDADEIFSEQFVRNYTSHISKMKPGQTLIMPWILVGENIKGLVYDVEQTTNYKDFVFCDDKESRYEQKFLSEPRTPGGPKGRIALPFSEGAVYHFQNLATKRNQLKQAWYRINELLKGERSARKINATYHYTKDLSTKNPVFIEDSFVKDNSHLIRKDASYEFYLERLQKEFNEKGILFFEGLDIWHIHELHELFLKETRREPKPSLFPFWVLHLNDIKNRIKNAILR